MFQKRSIAHSMNGEQTMPDPEVAVKAKRRKFSAEYKVRVLKEVDNCTAGGEVGALLRREGLYSSNLTQWRRQQKAGGLGGLTPQKRGRKQDEQAAAMAQLQRENERLRKQLGQAELIIDAQKKLAQVLETLTNQADVRS
jgi:transposase